MDQDIAQSFNNIVTQIVNDQLGVGNTVSDFMITFTSEGAKAEFDVNDSDYEVSFSYDPNNQQYTSNDDLTNIGMETDSTDESSNDKVITSNVPADNKTEKLTGEPKDNPAIETKSEMDSLKTQVTTIQKAFDELMSKLNEQKAEVIETKADSEPVVEPETKSEPAVEPVVEPETKSEPAVEPAVEPVVEPVVEPETKSEPAVELTPPTSPQETDNSESNQKAITNPYILGAEYKRYL